MNPSPSHSDSMAEDQAALWAARLDGSTLSANDRAALDAWLAEDPRHRVLLSQYCQFSADLEEQLPVLVAAGAVELPPEKAPVRRSTRRALWVGTMLAAAAAVAIGIWAVRPSQQVETVATSVAQRKTLTLADGSRVELNARTSLLAEIGRHERHVRLADGEAFFTVAKDSSRPFIVETPAGSVRVTGTVFNVHAETAAGLKVTVVEGSVQVRPGAPAGGQPADPVSLRANDQLISGAEGVQVRSLSASDLDDVLAWRDGFVVFQGTPLREALARLARYHGRTINADSAIAREPISGRYPLDDLEGALKAIQEFLPVRVSTDSSGAIVVTPRTGSSVP